MYIMTFVGGKLQYARRSTDQRHPGLVKQSNTRTRFSPWSCTLGQALSNLQRHTFLLHCHD